jgi:hypothetical protein
MSKSEGTAGCQSSPRRTDFSIETLLRKDARSVVRVNIEERQEFQVDSSDSLAPVLETESDHSHLQFSSDPDEPEVTGQEPEEDGEKDDSALIPLPGKGNIMGQTFSWLTCTRFKPPKLPRKLSIHSS